MWKAFWKIVLNKRKIRIWLSKTYQSFDDRSSVSMKQVNFVDDEEPNELGQRNVAGLSSHNVPLFRSRHQHLEKSRLKFQIKISFFETKTSSKLDFFKFNSFLKTSKNYIQRILKVAQRRVINQGLTSID